MGWVGMECDGLGWARMQREGMGWDGMGWDIIKQNIKRWN